MLEKICLLDIFPKKNFFCIVKICVGLDLTLFASSCAINLLAIEASHNALQCYVGSFKVWARPGKKKVENLNITQFLKNEKKSFRRGSNSGPPACKSNALTIQPRWLTT